MGYHKGPAEGLVSPRGGTEMGRRQLGGGGRTVEVMPLFNEMPEGLAQHQRC